MFDLNLSISSKLAAYRLAAPSSGERCIRKFYQLRLCGDVTHMHTPTLSSILSNPAAAQSKSAAVINVQRTSRASQKASGAGVPTRVDGLHEAFVRGVNQLLRLLVHIPDKECFIEVSMETVVVDRDVNCVNKNSADVTRRTDPEDLKTGSQPLRMSPSCSSLLSGMP